MGPLLPSSTISSFSTSHNASNNKIMVGLAADELFIRGWDGRDKTVFQHSPSGKLFIWDSCIFTEEDFAEIQTLVLEKLSRRAAEMLARTEANKLEGRVQARSSNNDDDDGEESDPNRLQTATNITEQVSFNSSATNPASGFDRPQEDLAVQTMWDRSQFEAESATQTASSSSSQEASEKPTLSAPADVTVSPGIKDLSGQPRLEVVLEAVSWARATEKDPTKALAHHLEHFNKDWLFKLYEQTKSPELLTILGQKIEIRLEFEKCLKQLSANSTTAQRPSCFICFALVELDILSWLEKVFVPDLAMVDVDPVVCFRQFGPGKELNPFQTRIRTTDKVVIICTPLLKKNCVERQSSPTGSAQEIRLAKERYNDKEKYQTIFPVFLKGQRDEALPDPFFEPILATVLNENGNVVWSYYAKAFELFAGIRGIDRPEARKIKERFFRSVETILEKQNYRFDQLKQMSQDQDSESEIRVKSVSDSNPTMTKKMTLPPYPVNFIGRNNELETLKSLYENDIRHVAIIGPSGIGKSALALAFAYQQTEQGFEFIYVIQVSEQAPLKQGLLKLADELDIGGTDEGRLTGLKKKLKEFNQKHLIVFDNIDDADHFDELTNLMSYTKGCCILLTSVMTESSRQLGLSQIKLEPFKPKEAAEFLQHEIHVNEDEHVRSLTRQLYFFPLALARAAEYIRKDGSSLRTFLKKYQTEGTNLLKLGRPHLTSWNIFLTRIHAKMNGNTCATHLLTFCALFPNNSITRDTLEAWASVHKFGLDLARSLQELKEFALIENSKTDFYMVSPLVRKEIIDNLLITAKRKNFLHGLEFEKYVFFKEQQQQLANPREYEDDPTMTGQSKRPISAAVNLLTRDKFVRLMIDGHRNTDSGTKKQLSEQRAQYVKDLIKQHHATFENRITARGMASFKPIDASTSPGFERNRVAVIRIDVEKTIERENLLPMMNFEDLLRARESSRKFDEDPHLKFLLVEALKSQLYEMNFAQFVFFFDNRTELVNPAQYEGESDTTKIERPLTATLNLLREYPFIHIRIEGHHAGVKDNEQESQISNARANYLKNLLVEKAGGNPKTYTNRISTIGVGADKPLDTAAMPNQKRNRVAIIRIDIDKSTKAYMKSLLEKEGE